MEGIRVGQNRKIAQSEKNPNCDKLNYHQQRGKNESHKIVVAAYASFTWQDFTVIIVDASGTAEPGDVEG